MSSQAGAVRDRVRMYDHLGGGEMKALYHDDAPQVMAERALESVAAGYTAVKVLAVPRTLPVDGTQVPIKRAAATMAAIREAVGDSVDIMVDFHGRTTPAMASRTPRPRHRIVRSSSKSPCRRRMSTPSRRSRARTTIPVATGERLVGRSQFREVLEKQACAVIQPDLCHCGGLWEARKIAAMAEAYYVAVAPHNPLGPIATAACIHFAIATPNFLIQEAIAPTCRGGTMW